MYTGYKRASKNTAYMNTYSLKSSPAMCSCSNKKYLNKLISYLHRGKLYASKTSLTTDQFRRHVENTTCEPASIIPCKTRSGK